ncbi:MAG: hypothetical protein ACRDTJ_18870, partial [Pseudonocardiaceae bacterium]
GEVNPRTRKGECSIKVFALGREDLKTARNRIAEQTRTYLLMQESHARDFGNLNQFEALDEAEAAMKRLINERTTYSAAKRAALTRAVAEERERLRRN